MAITAATPVSVENPKSHEILIDETALKRRIAKVFGILLLAFSLLFLASGIGAAGAGALGLLGIDAIATGNTLFMMGLLGSVTGLHFAFVKPKKDASFFTTLGIGPFSLRFKGDS